MAFSTATFMLYLMIIDIVTSQIIPETKIVPNRYLIGLETVQRVTNSYADTTYFTDDKFDVEHLNKVSYVFSTHSLPSDPRLWPSVGNGHIATVVHSPNILMNGLYNGRAQRSHRASIPSPVNVNVTSFGLRSTFNRTYTLDMRLGLFEETLLSEGCRMTLRWYAHSTIESLIVFDVKVIRKNSNVPLKIVLDVDQFRASEDFVFRNISVQLQNVSYRYGETLESETSSSSKQQVHVLFDTIPKFLVVDIGENIKQWTFLCAIHARKRIAFAAYMKGSKYQIEGKLLSTHVQSWINTWNKGRIDIKGNVSISRAAVASYYYILSSVPRRGSKNWTFIGLSPSGLAWGDSENYFGHVFWDQETWMYPPILMLHSDVADTLLSTRVRTLSTARRNANETGYRGARYPWESAVTGTETTESDICASMEIHINADISFAILQYWRANGDEVMLKQRRYLDVALGIADFWISRVTFNSTMKKYEILGVQPPDEYSVNVSNSVFTNSAASLSLMLAARFAKLTGSEKWKKYDNYARNIYIPYDDTIGYHPEYSGYVNGTLVKQADTILMGFPLMWPMSNQVRLNDLQIYEPVTSATGPAMSDSMFAIGWLELKQYNRAVKSFTKMFQHVSPDFQLWTENKGGTGATNFITGMGGYLQAILFGFGGLRLRDDRLDIDPVLPPGCSEMNLIGIDYLESSLNIAVSDQSVTVTLTKESVKLSLEIDDGSTRQPLVLNKSVTLRAGKATIRQSLSATSLRASKL